MGFCKAAAALFLILLTVFLVSCVRRVLGTFEVVTFTDVQITPSAQRIAAMKTREVHVSRSTTFGGGSQWINEMECDLIIYDTSGAELSKRKLRQDSAYFSCGISAVTDSSALIYVGDSIGMYSFMDGKLVFFDELVPQVYHDYGHEDYVLLNESEILYGDDLGYLFAVKHFDLATRKVKTFFTIEGNYRLASGHHSPARTTFLYRAIIGEFAIALLKIDSGTTTAFVPTENIINACAFGSTGLAIYHSLNSISKCNGLVFGKLF